MSQVGITVVGLGIKVLRGYSQALRKLMYLTLSLFSSLWFCRKVICESVVSDSLILDQVQIGTVCSVGNSLLAIKVF